MNRRRELPAAAGSEYQHFAEEFVDLLVDPKKEWLPTFIVNRGLDHIPTDEEFESGNFALRVLNTLERTETELIKEALYEALVIGDREFLIRYTKEWAEGAALSDGQMQMLLKMGHSSSLDKSFKQLRSKFRLRRGGKTKLSPRQYHKVLERAEQLQPAIDKVLREQASTTHTLHEILEYCQKDYPEAGEFLLRHINHLGKAFNEKRVMSRARKRIPAKAQAVADAMAGIEYGLAFSTSMERVGQERRRSRRKKHSEDLP